MLHQLKTGVMVTRQASFLPETGNAEKRTIELTWTTGAKVLKRTRSDEPYYEALSLEPGHVRLERLNAGAPLLDSHSARSLKDQIGVVEKAWIDQGQGRAIVRLSERSELEGISKDIFSGVIRNVSVGYKVRRYVGTSSQLPTFHFNSQLR